MPGEKGFARKVELRNGLAGASYFHNRPAKNTQ